MNGVSGKKLALWVITLFVLISEGRAQGKLAFTSRTQRGDVPVYWPDGTGPGPRATAGLYLVQGDSLTLLSTEPFRPRADLAYYFSGGSVEVPGIPPFAPATFRVRVWETSAGSYENAIATGAVYGEFPTVNGNNEVTIELGDGIRVLPTLIGIQSFTLVPEPSSLAIFGLTGAVIYMGRMRPSERSKCEGLRSCERELT